MGRMYDIGQGVSQDDAEALKWYRKAVLLAGLFLVVDCLLPGKVRRLGKRVTFVTERRAPTSRRVGEATIECHLLDDSFERAV